MITPSYWKEVDRIEPSIPVNGHVVDASKITPAYALLEIGRRGLTGIERSSMTPDELTYRGGKIVAKKLFSRWFRSDLTEVTIGTSQLVDMLAKQGNLPDAEKTALATHFGNNTVTLPYSPTNAILAKHPLKPVENANGNSVPAATVPDLEVYVLTK